MVILFFFVSKICYQLQCTENHNYWVKFLLLRGERGPEKTPSTLRHQTRCQEKRITFEDISWKKKLKSQGRPTVLHHHPSERWLLLAGRRCCPLATRWMGRRMGPFLQLLRRKTLLLWKRPALMIHLSLSLTDWVIQSTTGQSKTSGARPWKWNLRRKK